MYRIGFWPNSIYNDFCFPQELPLCMDEAERASLVSYLRSGRVHVRYRGYSSCRYRCGVPHTDMGSADLTDGIWVWPEGLAHYVEVHHISLPSLFVVSVLGIDHPPSPAGALEAFDWRSWCDAQRTDASRELIRELKQKCDAEIEVRLDEHFERVTRNRGTADTTCIWQGCTHRALKGLVFCARHLVTGTNDGEHGDIAYTVRDQYTNEFLKSLGCPRD